MIKIAFVIDSIISPTGGTEKHILSLLLNLDRKRFSPYLCVLRSSEWLESEFRVCPVHEIGIRSFKHLSSYYGILKFTGFLRREGIDIVQTYYRDAGIAGIIAAWLAGTGHIISARRNQGYWLDRRELIVQKLLNRRVALFIANSCSTKRWSHNVEGIPAERIRVIYNCIDLAQQTMFSRKDSRAFREELGIPLRAPVVGIVANLRSVKGIDVFLRAAGFVRDSLPEARFVIVGDGEEEAGLRGLAGELGLELRTYFLGRRRDVFRVLGALDVAVLSSHSESLSNSIVEYLAAGVPVVCTDVGGCREAVEDGVNGFIVPPGDPAAMAEGIIRIIEGGMFSFMHMNNREKARRKFSLPRAIMAYEQLYTDLMGAGGIVVPDRLTLISTKEDRGGGRL